MLVNAPTLHSLVIIRGDATTFPYEFSAPITATVLQKSTGTFFVGVADPTDDPTFSIAKALRPNFLSTPKFIGIATDPNVQGTTIEFLTVSDQQRTEENQKKITCNTMLPFVISANNGIAFEATQVSVIFDDGSDFTQTTTLNDAFGNTTAGIVQIATSMTRATTNTPRSVKSVSDVFAAVRPDTGNFGDDDSGIALMSLACTSTTIIFNTLDAQTGQPGNEAQLLDETSTELKGDSDGDDVIFSDSAEDVNQVALYYDDPFERLYIGVRIETGATQGDIAKSVVVGYVDDDNALALEPIVSDAAIDPTGIDQIVVIKNSASSIGPNLRANNLGVMHTSAGPSYLIVQGGKGQTNQVGNLIFALPLVDDPSDPEIHGTLADKNAELEDFKFIIPAEDPDDLATADDPAAQVGTGSLPILPSNQISNMAVEGDAVYVSIALPPSPTNDSGILYSQALFADDGRIIDWTPWTKQASPVDLFPQLHEVTGEVTSGVSFFAVDASTGNIYIVAPIAEEDLVGITAWTEQVSTSTALTTTLINELNDVLELGCYSALDLPQSVRGFTGTDAPLSRYALFGGVNSVIFTRISQAYDQDIDSPQIVINDFEDPENFLVTKLPPQAGCVQVLEYSRQTSDESDTNYFFAGTDNGLFAFANAAGEGFNVDILETLNQPPFTTGRWQKIPEITGSVIDIKSSGLALYILTFETSAETPLKNTLYRVSFEDNLEDMFHPFMNIRILAQTKTEPVFGTTQLFTGIQIIATGDPANVAVTADKEQLILATNQGLYKSNANQNNANEGIAEADDQNGANWELVQTTTNVMYTGISGIETPIRHTTWPISVRDKNNCYSFDASSIEQLSGNGDPTIADDTGEVDFAPIFFNADVDTPAFNTLEPITYFFSDGGRRFFIINPTGISSTRTKLSVIPFDTQTWRVQAPHILKYPALQAIQRFFWVETIGMSGVVLAGTDRGVIGLT